MLLYNLLSEPQEHISLLESRPYTARQLEELILATQDLLIGKNVFVYDVKLPRAGGHMHTIEAGKGNPRTIVLVHGYGATAVFWCQVIIQLAKDYHVYAIDQYGMGLSAKPDFDFKDHAETTNFFCDAIDEWRERCKIDQFSLMGHSFGGYTVTQYCRIKRPNLNHLYLLSPGGFTNAPTEYEKPGLIAKLFPNLMVYLFSLSRELQFSPFQLANLLGKKHFQQSFFSGKRFPYSQKTADLIAMFYHLISSLPPSGDKGLALFLTMGKYADQPIIDDLLKMKREGRLPPITVFYGDSDWMDVKYSTEQNKKTGLNADFVTVTNAGHQILLQNPAFICRFIYEKDGLEYKPITVVDRVNNEFELIIDNFY